MMADLQRRSQSGFHDLQCRGKQLVKDCRLLEEVRAEEVLRGGGVHQQLVGTPEQQLQGSY